MLHQSQNDWSISNRFHYNYSRNCISLCVLCGPRSIMMQIPPCYLLNHFMPYLIGHDKNMEITCQYCVGSNKTPRCIHVFYKLHCLCVFSRHARAEHTKYMHRLSVSNALDVSNGIALKTVSILISESIWIQSPYADCIRIYWPLGGFILLINI